MYLKSLQLQGFKSFADKTDLKFDEGITAVVGPNGSGKSNISDAVRWVLGEQSAKSLRGSKMEDIIFTGTQHRKALGYAEVALTVSNEDGVLPVEYDEVVVKRRVYRSGESEYLMNGSNCRLKDIYELFLDTGVGRDGYSIIGQGKIDEILSSRSEDRRLVFEEASGIMKYKVRKNEAERKLEHTAQNLLRINDIINELELHVEPLREQSEKARMFLRLRDELKDIEVSVYLENIERIGNKMKENEKSLFTQQEAVTDANKKLQAASEAAKEKDIALKELDVSIESLRTQYYKLENEIERSDSESKVNEERSSSVQANIERLSAEISESKEKLNSYDDSNEKQSQKLEYLNQQLAIFQGKLKKQESDYALMVNRLSERDQKIESIRAEIVDKQDILSDKKMQAGNVGIHIDGINRRRKTISNDIFHNKLEIDKEEMAKEDFLEQLGQLLEKQKSLQAHIDDNQTQIQELRSALEEKKKKQEEISTALNYKRSRHKMLIDMENSLEGYNRSVKSILKAKKQNLPFAKGIKGALAQLISVEDTYEKAIEYALGNALQNIVVEDEFAAKSCIKYLKDNALGRATFLPVNTIQGRILDHDHLQRIKKLPGFIDIAANLVQSENTYTDIIASFLGRVAVVDTYENGVCIAKAMGHKIKLVTLDGEIFNAGGSITGGGKEGRDFGLVSRNREIEQLTGELGTLNQNLQNINLNIKDLTDMLNSIENKLAESTSQKQAFELELLKANSNISHIESTVNRLKAHNDMLASEDEQLAKETADEQKDLDCYGAEISGFDDSIFALKEELGHLQSEYKAENQKREVFYEDITNLKISINSILESIHSAKEISKRLDDEREEISVLIVNKENEIINQNQYIKVLEQKNAEIGLCTQSNIQAKETVAISLEEKLLLKAEQEGNISETIENINEMNRNIIALQEDINRIEIKKERYISEIDNIQNKLWEDYELTVANARPLYKKTGSITASQKNINDLKSAIKALGDINVSSIEEYANTIKRLAFMTEQKDDLEEGKAKLVKVIEEMTEVMKKQFIEQFKLININFSEVFKTLFHGGRAEIKLGDEKNVLECGIDIIAQPPGKRLQNMMLLSGGEKALTAIALLFAILKIRPTPFCILDEIEAALDEANVQRFGQYLCNFSKDIQFIVVTHRKGTMEISDAMYGVTMQEHGISKMVSLKLSS